MPASGAISEIAFIFATNEEFDSQLNKTLAVTGSSLGVSRCYLFLNSPDGTTTTNTHEWCAEGIVSLIAQRQTIPYSGIPSWKGIFEHDTVYAVNTDILPVDISAVFGHGGTRSIIIAPVRIGECVCGFMGLDECVGHRVWSAHEIETLKTVSGIFSTAYSRKLLADQVTASEENFRSFFNTVDDIIVIGDLEGRLVFANEGAIRKLGYSLEELRGKKILELYPEDKWGMAGALLDEVLRKKRARYHMELRARNGVNIPVETRTWFGQWDGRECVFCVSKDISAEQTALQKFERLFRGNPAVMAVSAVNDDRLVDVNESFLQILGYEREEVIGRSGLDLGLFIDAERVYAVREELLSKGLIRNRELILRRRDGSLINGLLSGDMIEGPGERCFLMVMVDITRQIRLQIDLEAEHNRLANIIESTKLGTWEWNVKTGETVFNDRWADMLGYTIKDLMPTTIRTWEELCHPDDLVEAWRLLNLHFEGIDDHYECEMRLRHKKGSWVWIYDRGKVVEWDIEGRPLKMYGTHADITEKKVMEEQIHDLAIRDPLTEVYNRRYIFERLKGIGAEYARMGRNFCISILDLDHFKDINDTYGHQAGDFVLREFALAINSMIRQYDLFGRYGGEEFIVVSTNVTGSETSAMIERIMGVIRERAFMFEGSEIRFTFSCGIADSSEFKRGAFSIQDMVGLADRRLYEAKVDGRDRIMGP